MMVRSMAIRNETSTSTFSTEKKNYEQAALLVTNGLAVLNNDRCLEKCE